MKVFISWSGDTSQKVAEALGHHLHAVIQAVKPYLSKHIEKGARWAPDIAKELDETNVGIVCVTRGNMDEPWLNFEAGAIAKSVETGRLCPFLFGVSKSDLKAPLAQFQATTYDQEDVFELLKSMNGYCEHDDEGLSPDELKEAFERWWPVLQDKLDGVSTEEAKGPPEPDDAVKNMLEQLLDLGRANQRMLRNPEELFPPEYIDKITAAGHVSPGQLFRASVAAGAVQDLVGMYSRARSLVPVLEEAIEGGNKESIDNAIELLRARLIEMKPPIHHLGLSNDKINARQLEAELLKADAY